MQNATNGLHPHAESRGEDIPTYNKNCLEDNMCETKKQIPNGKVCVVKVWLLKIFLSDAQNPEPIRKMICLCDKLNGKIFLHDDTHKQT